MSYIKNPNLPDKKVTIAAISCLAGESIEKLNNLGIKTLIVKPNVSLPKPINTHADIQMLHIKNNLIFCQGEHLFREESSANFKFYKIKEKAGNLYPHDVRLNCTIIGRILICNEKTISKDILEIAYKNEMQIINVNQGYSKCSVCIINDKTIITDDESIYTAAGKFLNDAVLISKGSVVLKGYNYGFIGGCCGKIDKDKIAFNGKIESHNDCNKIIDILQRNNTEIIELCDSKLTDIGGILPLYEED